MDAIDAERKRIARRIRSIRDSIRNSPEHVPSYKTLAIHLLERVVAEAVNDAKAPRGRPLERWRHGKLKARIQASKLAKVADDGPVYD